jgi:hypothetical protein
MSAVLKPDPAVERERAYQAAVAEAGRIRDEAMAAARAAFGGVVARHTAFLDAKTQIDAEHARALREADALQRPPATGRRGACFALALLSGAALVTALMSPAVAQAPAGPAQGNGYPENATAFVVSATGTTSANVSLPGNLANANITYVCSINMTESGGSAVSANGTLTHVIGPTTLQYSQLGQLAQTFTPCLPGDNSGSAMVATTPTSTGATASSVIVTGYTK